MFKLVYLTAATLLVAVVNAAPTLSELPDYKYFKSEIYPGYGVRYVNPQLCDPNVTQYAGYLDMGPKHYHFWFFESKQNPTEKPLTAYLAGGPGCTGQVAVWSENSPCVAANNGTEIGYRETTWTHLSNMFYIDQPTGAGFSYQDKLILTVEEAAAVFYEALQLFYEAFPKYNNLPFHMFGESYSGISAPIYAKYIIDQNLKLEKSQLKENNALASKQIIPLKSIGIMSGIIDPLTHTKNTGLNTCKLRDGNTISPATCQELKKNYDVCGPLIRRCFQTNNTFDCRIASTYCALSFQLTFYRNGYNKSDIRVKDRDLKVPQEDYIKIIERPDFQRSIGAYPKKKVDLCSSELGLSWTFNGQFVKNTLPILSAVIDHGVKVLAAAGDTDFVGNWYGTQEGLSKLKFNGSESYSQLEMRPWFVRNKQAGEVKSTDQLTFVLMYESGHILSAAQPENTFVMFDNWINDKKFLNE